MPIPNPEIEEALVTTWNQVNPPETPVTVRLDDGSNIKTKTSSTAWVLGGHTAVVKLYGIHGAYKLSRVTAIQPETQVS